MSITTPATPTTQPVQQKPASISGGASSTSSGHAVQLKQSLAGKDFAQQEAMLAPAAAVQMRGNVQASAEAVHQHAEAGTRGGGGSLPHLGAIQKSFGGHDVSGVKAYSGGDASAACDGMGAAAYATDDKIAFKGGPDLHTAAHEAAHVVQQRGGVSLAGGVGQSGDGYEQHADRVADAVVAGRSAEPILNQMSGGTGVQMKASVQRDDAAAPPAPAPAGGFLELKPGADFVFGGDVIYVYRGEKHGMKVGFAALGQFEGLETESLSGVVIKVFPTRCQVKLAAPKHDHKDPAQKTSLADGLKALRVSMGTEKPPEFPPPAPLTPEQQKKQDDAAGGCHPAPGADR